MTIYRYTNDAIEPIQEATFAELSVAERNDLQRLLRDQIEIIAPDTLVIAEEFADWDGSQRRIDLLGIDRNANLVVFELKRTTDGGHMDLQAIRYASMVSSMTFAHAVRIFAGYNKLRGRDIDAEKTLLAFLGWTEPVEEDFAGDVSIVLASAEFGKEITTAVLWLRDKGVDIRCVRIKPYGTKELTVLDVQQVIPLPEAEDYVIRVREKTQQERVSRLTNRDYSKYRVSIDGKVTENLAKRRAVLHVVRAIVDAGVSLETLQQDITWKYLYLSIPGILDGERMRAAIDGQLKGDSSRWFTDDGELIHLNGTTYAISNQWGTRSMEAVACMIGHCATVKITCEPMS